MFKALRNPAFALNIFDFGAPAKEGDPPSGVIETWKIDRLTITADFPENETHLQTCETGIAKFDDTGGYHQQGKQVGSGVPRYGQKQSLKQLGGEKKISPRGREKKSKNLGFGGKKKPSAHETWSPYDAGFFLAE